MPKPAQCGQGMDQHLVRRLIRDAGNEADATGIVVKAWV
jgi:hypothetical protein